MMGWISSILGLGDATCEGGRGYSWTGVGVNGTVLGSHFVGL